MTAVTYTTLFMPMAVDMPQDDAGHDVECRAHRSGGSWERGPGYRTHREPEAAQQVIAEMLPDERADLAAHLEELRKLLGPTCAECGALTEIGIPPIPSARSAAPSAAAAPPRAAPTDNPPVPPMLTVRPGGGPLAPHRAVTCTHHTSTRSRSPWASRC